MRLLWSSIGIRIAVGVVVLVNVTCGDRDCILSHATNLLDKQFVAHGAFCLLGALS